MNETVSSWSQIEDTWQRLLAEDQETARRHAALMLAIQVSSWPTPEAQRPGGVITELAEEFYQFLVKGQPEKEDAP